MREPTEYKGPSIQRSDRFDSQNKKASKPGKQFSLVPSSPGDVPFFHGYGDVSTSRVHLSIVSRRGRPLATDTVEQHLEHPGKPETDACFKVEQL